ncbi:MAG: hypothetical protein CMN30_06525 [Sandaracinus sp.]|nr:hypothetical protein [Sandaracinus sp.]|tara:strand:+ start:419 stop:817 length:399 start_codon:yes stop_codon:yes gene_type:complete
MIRYAALVLTCLALLAGCSKDPVNETHNGALETSDSQHPNDQSFYDAYEFKADEGWQINVTMTAADPSLQPYLQLRREGVDDAMYLEENSGAPATITTVAPASGTYVVWANSLSAGQTGNYTVTISAQPTQQ